MAGVEWDYQKHYLAGAVDADGHDIVMVDKEGENIRVCEVDEVTTQWVTTLENPQNLTPNGKHYELCEIRKVPETAATNEPAEPEHPAVLSTVEDYKNAPDGTIVAGDSEIPVVKNQHTWYAHGFKATSETMARLKDLPVVRWGEKL